MSVDVRLIAYDKNPNNNNTGIAQTPFHHVCKKLR
jgi:hypothetical protein